MSNSLQNLSSQKPFDTLFVDLLDEVFDKASARVNKRVGQNKQEKSDLCVVNSDGGYKCIHLPVVEFIWKISALIKEKGWKKKDIQKLKFVDVGCGVGQKVCLAKTFGFQSFGLELRKELIREAKKIFCLFDFDLEYGDAWADEKIEKVFIQADALTYPDYSRFDVIYFYCPLFQHDLQAELELQIAKTAKVGTIVLPFLAFGVFSGCNDGDKEDLAYYRKAIKLGWQRYGTYFIRESLGE